MPSRRSYCGEEFPGGGFKWGNPFGSPHRDARREWEQRHESNVRGKVYEAFLNPILTAVFKLCGRCGAGCVGNNVVELLAERFEFESGVGDVLRHIRVGDLILERLDFGVEFVDLGAEFREGFGGGSLGGIEGGFEFGIFHGEFGFEFVQVLNSCQSQERHGEKIACPNQISIPIDCGGGSGIGFALKGQ